MFYLHNSIYKNSLCDRCYSKFSLPAPVYSKKKKNINQVTILPYFTDNKRLRTIRHTLIFKQFFLKTNRFTIFIIRLQSQTKKNLYKPNWPLKSLKIVIFVFSYSLLAPNREWFFPLVEGQNAAQLLCFHVLHMLLLSIYSPHHMNTFYFFPLRN